MGFLPFTSIYFFQKATYAHISLRVLASGFASLAEPGRLLLKAGRARLIGAEMDVDGVPCRPTFYFAGVIFGVPLFSTNQAKQLSFFAGVLIPAKFRPPCWKP